MASLLMASFLMAPSDCAPHQVLGVLKEMATLLIASVVLGDQVRL
jgi:hypothetical protein